MQRLSATIERNPTEPPTAPAKVATSLLCEALFMELAVDGAPKVVEEIVSSISGRGMGER